MCFEENTFNLRRQVTNMLHFCQIKKNNHRRSLETRRYVEPNITPGKNVIEISKLDLFEM